MLTIAPSNRETVEEQSKKVDVEKVLRVAEYDANKPSVIVWGVLGFVLTVIGILIVYVRSPKIGTSAIFRYGNSGNLLQIYEIHYTTTLKQRQVKASWIGLLAEGLPKNRSTEKEISDKLQERKEGVR